MNQAVVTLSETVAVPHFIKGELVRGTDQSYGPSGGTRFATPALQLDQLVWSRQIPGPAFDVPTAEILDLLDETGKRLRQDPDGHLAEALDNMARTSTFDHRILGNCYADLGHLFDRRILEFQLNNELGGIEVLDGWRETVRSNGRAARLRAFPPRMITIMAGNSPGVAASSIMRGALVKGLNLLKLPSNDLFTATAILRTMAAIAPGHPTVRSFSVAYWRGGDEAVESAICRPQYFDKIAAWGGDAALRGIKRYIGPGLELIAFDPKTSISFIGREAFASPSTLAEVAEAAALDATPFNQGACVSSRVQFIEGTPEQIDRYCELLQQRLTLERRTTAAVAQRVPAELREEIDVLRTMEDGYRVWGGYDGAGLVIRSDEPVDFYCDNKIVNVVPVASLQEAIRFATVASSTVGIYPAERKAEVRDGLASAGVQRVVTLGQAIGQGVGIPHDGFYPLQRMIRWVNDED